MVDKNININAKVDVGQAVAGIKQLADAMKGLKNYKQEFSKGNFLAGVAGGAAVESFHVVERAIAELTNKIKEFGVESSKTSMKYDGLVNRFNAAAGGTRSGSESWIFMKNLSKELGVSFVEASESFGTFEAAALRSGMSMDQTKQVFSDISAATVSLQLDSYRTGLSFMALSQMASKGTVQMEELKRQLGESLPGAVQIGARAMGMSNAEFHKMVEEGKLLSNEFLPKFAAQVKKELGGSVEVASKQARAEFTRFSNATMDLKDSLGDLIHIGIVPFIRSLTPLTDNLAKSIEKLVAMETATHNLRDGLGEFGDLFSTPVGMIKTTAETTKGLLEQKSILGSLAQSLLLYSLGVDNVSGSLKRSDKELDNNIKSLIEQEMNLKSTSEEMAKEINRYDSLRSVKKRTNEEQKEFVELQNILIKTFPDIKSGLLQNKSATALLADEFNKAEIAILDARKALLLFKMDTDIKNTQIGALDPAEATIRSKMNAAEIKQIETRKKLLNLKGNTSGAVTGTGTGNGESERVNSIVNQIKQGLEQAKNEFESYNLIDELFGSKDIQKIGFDINNQFTTIKDNIVKTKDIVYKSYVDGFEPNGRYRQVFQDFFKEIKDGYTKIEEENNKQKSKKDKNQIMLSEKQQEDLKSQIKETALIKLKTKLLDIERNYEKERQDIRKQQNDINQSEFEKDVENHNKLIDNEISSIEILSDEEIRIGNKTEKEKLDIQIAADKKILELLKQRLYATYDESVKNAEDIAKKRIEIEENEQKQKQRLTNKYGGRYGVSFRERLQETIDQMPDTSKWEKFWKDFANVVADAIDSLSQKISNSLADNIEKVLDGTQTLKEGFKAFYEDLKQYVRRMIAEIIAEMINLYIIKPFLEDIFGSVFGRKRQGGGTTLLTGLSSGLGLLGFANGGDPPVGVPYIVGEDGPEIAIDRSPKTIIPNHKLGGGTSNYVYAPNIKTGASADEVFSILDKHSRKFFAMVQDGVENNSGLRNAVRVGS